MAHFFRTKLVRIEAINGLGDLHAHIDDVAGVAVCQEQVHPATKLVFMNAVGRGELDGYEPDASQPGVIQLLGQLQVVNIRGANDLEWSVGAPSDRDDALEQANAGVKNSFGEVAHVRGGIGPGQFGLVEPQIAAPVLERNDGEV